MVGWSGSFDNFLAELTLVGLAVRFGVGYLLYVLRGDISADLNCLELAFRKFSSVVKRV